MNAMRHRVKMINDFEARFFSEVVDAGDVEQIVERKFVAAKLCDLAEVAGGNRDAGLTAKFSLAVNFWAKRFAQRVEQILAVHRQAVILSGAKNLSLPMNGQDLLDSL